MVLSPDLVLQFSQISSIEGTVGKDGHARVNDYFDEFQRSYPERYQERYGFWRPIIGERVRKFLRCGDLAAGFARVRCPECRHEMFVAFSCRQRCFCPSCHQKRSLVQAYQIANDICARVPHRQFVWTIPKRLRIFFRFNRPLDFLAELTQHIPDKGERFLCYYGWYSYRQRGLRAKQASNGNIQIDRHLVRKARSDEERRSARAWAVLIQRVYEVDPLKCSKCGTQMKIISLCEVFDYVKWSHMDRRFPWVSGFHGGNGFT